jgi:SAM-dependent methyltransferase
MAFDWTQEHERLRDAFSAFLGGEPGAKIARLPEGLEAGVDYKAWYGKYVDWEKCLHDAFSTAARLRLHRGPSLRILDIGSGPGYFAWVCSHYGHRVTGLDFPGPYFGRFRALLNVECVEKPVRKWVTLPVDETGFDWITAIDTQFHRDEFVYGEGKKKFDWREAEWAFFIDDCLARLREDGKLYFKLNDAENTRGFLPSLLREKGIWSDGKHVVFERKRSQAR